MALYKEIYQTILEGSDTSRHALAVEVSDLVRLKTAEDPIWYCAKNQTTIAAKYKKSGCASRDEAGNDFHSARQYGCGLHWLVKDS